jgi:hypothetical protein
MRLLSVDFESTASAIPPPGPRGPHSNRTIDGLQPLLLGSCNPLRLPRSRSESESAPVTFISFRVYLGKCRARFPSCLFTMLR